jgi:hypothetical protein
MKKTLMTLTAKINQHILVWMHSTKTLCIGTLQRYDPKMWTKFANWQPHPYGQEVNPTKFEHNSFNCHVCCYSVNTIFFGPNFVQPRFFFFSKEPCYICRLIILWDGIQPETSRVRWLVMCSRIEIKKLRLFFSGVLFAPGKTMPLKCTILWDI